MSVKVIFKLEAREDGFPPVAFEALNAEVLEGGLFRIKNAPFFVANISYDDIIEASESEVAGSYLFGHVVEQSKFTSVSIIALDESMNVYLMDVLRGRDCVIEYGEFGAYHLLAVALPESVDYAALRTELQSLEDRELISFAELAVLQKHRHVGA
jgi:hypothetical protein